jgi:hypothetical protein
MLNSVNFIVSIPVAFCNVIYFFWIVKAFKRTLLYLKMKRQTLKYDVLFKINMVFVICLSLSIIIYIFEIFDPNMDGLMDKMWKKNCI